MRGLRLAPSVCIGHRTVLGPVPGSALKYLGENIVKSTAKILSARTTLEFLGM
nr:isocitrate/isopropylmalate family dehydrogenase [Candidatus Njordarchaeota archaeon]